MPSKLQSLAPVRSVLADKIRQTVADRGVSATLLAKKSELDRRAVSRFLAGVKDLNLASADRICVALNLELVAKTPPRKSPAARPAPRPLPDLPAFDPIDDPPASSAA